MKDGIVDNRRHAVQGCGVAVFRRRDRLVSPRSAGGGAAKIYDGPRTSDGRQIYPDSRPGASWVVAAGDVDHGRETRHEPAVVVQRAGRAEPLAPGCSLHGAVVRRGRSASLLDGAVARMIDAEIRISQRSSAGAASDHLSRLERPGAVRVGDHRYYTSVSARMGAKETTTRAPVPRARHAKLQRRARPEPVRHVARERGRPAHEHLGGARAIGWRTALHRCRSLARPADPPRSRPLCAYPQIAKYKGRGTVDDAANLSVGIREQNCRFRAGFLMSDVRRLQARVVPSLPEQSGKPAHWCREGASCSSRHTPVSQARIQAQPWSQPN